MGEYEDDRTIILKYIANLAGCQVCLQKFTQPRFLHCMHVFCYKCVAPLVQDNHVSCPQCQFETVLKNEGLHDKRHVVPEIIEVLRAGRNICEECLTAHAELHCKKCDAPMCKPCHTKTHSASRLFAHHKIVHLIDGRPQRPEPVCDMHPEEKIRYLCTTDQALLCRDCLYSGYKNEAYVNIEEAGHSARVRIQHLINRARERVALILGGEQAVASIVPLLVNEYHDMINRIESRTDAVATSINQRRDALVKEANDRKELKVARILEQSEWCKIIIAGLNNAIRVAIKLLEVASDFEILEMQSEMEWRLKNLSELPLPTVLVDDATALTSLDDPQMEQSLGVFAKPTGESALSAAAKHQKLYAIGGSDGTTDLETLEAYDVDSDTWTLLNKMSSRRRGLATAILNNVLYVLGGWGQKRKPGEPVTWEDPRPLDTVERYDVASDSWSPVSSMCNRRQGVAAAALNGRIFAIGGFDGKTNLDTVERFDPVANQWIHVAKMTQKRRGAAAVVLHGKLYAIGGYDGSRYHNSVEVYDPMGNKWSPVASMEFARSSVAAAVLQSKLYVAGGWDGSRALNVVEVYDPLTDQWTTKRGTLGFKRQGAAMGVVKNKLVVAGGWDGLGQKRLNAVEMYDAGSDRWVKVGSMNTPRYGVAAAVL